MKIVIVGNGTAGNEVASQIRHRDPHSEIVLISAESFSEYDPCALPYYLSGEISREVVFKRLISDYEKNQIQLILEDKAVQIDSAARSVIVESGRSFQYDRLVLAYGSRLFIPPIEGINKRGVFGGKQLVDIESLSLHAGRRAVVIGSGAIGIELAVALKERGYQVLIVERFKHILPTLFDSAPAEILSDLLKERGISVLTDEQVIRVEGGEHVTAVITNQRKIIGDTVVLAAGVFTDVRLAQTAKIAVNRGILVNHRMETNVQNIYACGDCAEVGDAITHAPCLCQLKHNALDQAQMVAKNILGKASSYSGSYPLARVHFYDTYAATFGCTRRACLNDSEVNVVERKRLNAYLSIILKKDRIIGAQAIGCYASKLWLLFNAYWCREDLSEVRKNEEKIFEIDSYYPWFYRELYRLIDD